MLVDERTNTLIISDVASQIPIIQGVLAKLDTKTKQVAIEARIVLANSSFQRTLSAALVGALSNPSGSTTGAAQTGTGASVTPSTTRDDTANLHYSCEPHYRLWGSGDYQLLAALPD